MGRSSEKGSMEPGGVKPLGELWVRALPDTPGVSLGVPRAVWGAPGPLHAGGCTCGRAVGLEGITCLSRGEVCPSSGGRTPPSQRGPGGSPQSAFVPALERMDWRQPGSAVSGDTGEPRVRQREGGQVEGWTNGHMKPMRGRRRW